MKQSDEELKQKRFFRNINLLTKHFFSGEKINLDQLEELATLGEISVSKPTMTLAFSDLLRKVKEIKFNEQEVVINKLAFDLRSNRFNDLLESNFDTFNVSLAAYNKLTSENLDLAKRIYDEIWTDKQVYRKDSYKRQPRLICWIKRPTDTNGRLMLFKPIGVYRAEPGLEFYHEYATTVFREGTIVITGKKKVSS